MTQNLGVFSELVCYPTARISVRQVLFLMHVYYLLFEKGATNKSIFLSL